MTVEDRISRALHDRADAVDVDLTRLHAATLQATQRRVRTPRRHAAVLVLATAVVMVATAVLGTAWLVDGSRTKVPSGSDPARGVAASFTCPRQVTVDDAGRGRDDSFLPSLAGGAAAAAAAEGAPRYDYAEVGDTATLRLGNSDGSLASIARFRRTSEGWDLVTTTKCVAADGGVLVPGRGAGRLGQHEAEPYPARQMIDNAGRAVLIDDRASYDVAGLVQHRSMWAAPCGRSICLASGSPTAMSTTTVRADARPHDITSMFLDPDDSEGRPESWGLWIVADPGRTVLDVRATTRGGQDVGAVRRRGPGWTGQVYVLLARPATVDAITVRTADGDRAYPTNDID